MGYYRFPSLLFGSQPGYLVFLVRGDSISAGFGATPGPTTTAGRVFEWDKINGGLIDRATTDFSTAASGSPWKQMAINLADATGKRIVMICCGLSGAEVFPNGGTDTHWAPNYDNAGASVPGGTGSVLYNNSLTHVSACLTFLNKLALDGICDIVGINDARGTATLTNIDAGLTSLYNKTNTDFPGVPIYATSIGRDETNSINAKKLAIKKYQRLLADNRSYYHLTANLLSFAGEAWQLTSDLLHPSQPGNNVLGNLYSRYILSTELNKEVRQVLNCYKDQFSTAHAEAIKIWVEALQAAGVWNKLDYFAPCVGTSRENVLVDLRFLGNPLDAGFTFNANNSIRVFGTSNHRRMGNLPASWMNATQNDFIVGAKVLVNNTAVGTNGYLFGVNETTPGQLVLAQLTSNDITYYANDKTGSVNATHTKFQDNTLYSVFRNGTTKGFSANDTTLASVTQASTGNPGINIFEGVRNNNATPGTPLDATLEYTYVAAYTGFDLAAFRSATNAMIAALKV